MTDGTDTTASPAAAAPVQPAAPMAPVARQSVADSVYQRLPVDQQQRYASIRGPDGGSEWVDRATLPSETGATTTSPADPAPISDPLAKVKVGDLEVSQAVLQEWMQSKAAAELKRASLPATPADYKPDLPPDFQMPAGISEFKFDTGDPLFVSAQAWAHARQIDQGTFSEMVGLYASAKATEAAQLNAAHAEQVRLMGPNGPMRVTALEQFFRGAVGDDRIAAQMKAMLVTADLVKGMERLQAKMTTQGVASFSQAHREPGQANNGRVSDEAYNAMTPGQRLDYSRQFDQSQFQQGR
jgi:hypothetical protein